MTTTALAKKPLRQVATVKELLVNEQAEQQLAAVAASHLTPKRMMRLVANAVRTTPALMGADPLSLLGALMTASSLGLEPNTVLGHAFLVPFKNNKKGITEVQLILGYKGLIDLARRSGHIVSIHADVAYDGDEFEFEYGSNQHLRHVPTGKREKPTHAYCHAKLTDGEAFIALPWDVVLSTRDASQGYRTAKKFNRTDNPWMTHLHQMARKTAVRALFNELPISIEKVSDAMEIDEAHIDYSGFATNPAAGILIDGEVIDTEDEGEGDKPEPEPEAEDKPRRGRPPKSPPEPRQSAKSEKPVPDTRETENAPQRASQRRAEPEEPEAELALDGDDTTSAGGLSDLPEEWEGLIGRFQGDIDECADKSEVEEIIDLFSDQIADLKKEHPGAHAELMDYVNTKMEQF